MKIEIVEDVKIIRFGEVEVGDMFLFHSTPNRIATLFLKVSNSECRIVGKHITNEQSWVGCQSVGVIPVKRLQVYT